MTFNTTMIEVIATTRSAGDGSSCIDWFMSRDVLNLMENNYPEDYASGEGGEIYFFPNSFDFRACGIGFSDDDCVERLREDGHM